MLRSSLKYRITLLFAAICILSMMMLSCENKIELIPESDMLSLPSVSSSNIKTVLSDSGLVQLIMTTPLIEQYNNTDSPYSEFRYGINVVFYNGHKEPVGSVSAKHATYTNETNLWELTDSVVVINESNDMLETEILFWDQKKDLIYTDRFVKITNLDQTIQGYGFESDSHLNNRKIRKVSATIYFNDEE